MIAQGHTASTAFPPRRISLSSSRDTWNEWTTAKVVRGTVRLVLGRGVLLSVSKNISYKRSEGESARILRAPAHLLTRLTLIVVISEKIEYSLVLV